jgi:hypothetical protein
MADKVRGMSVSLSIAQLQEEIWTRPIDQYDPVIIEQCLNSKKYDLVVFPALTTSLMQEFKTSTFEVKLSGSTMISPCHFRQVESNLGLFSASMIKAGSLITELSVGDRGASYPIEQRDDITMMYTSSALDALVQPMQQNSASRSSKKRNARHILEFMADPSIASLEDAELYLDTLDSLDEGTITWYDISRTLLAFINGGGPGREFASNCETRVVKISGKTRVRLTATHDISVGQELLWEY